MSILDDGINVMGSGAEPGPTPIAPVIATPADGSTYATGTQVVFTGTAAANASIVIEVRDLSNNTWSALIGPTPASADGVWTADPYTVDAAARVSLPVRAHDTTNNLYSAQITVNVSNVEALEE